MPHIFYYRPTAKSEEVVEYQDLMNSLNNGTEFTDKKTL
jgi:hypothetical protein